MTSGEVDPGAGKTEVSFDDYPVLIYPHRQMPGMVLAPKTIKKATEADEAYENRRRGDGGNDDPPTDVVRTPMEERLYLLGESSDAEELQERHRKLKRRGDRLFNHIGNITFAPLAVVIVVFHEAPPENDYSQRMAWISAIVTGISAGAATLSLSSHYHDKAREAAKSAEEIAERNRWRKESWMRDN